MERTHGVTHWDPDDCFGCRCQTIGVQPSAFITRRPQVAGQIKQEKTLVKDLDSYKRMRLDGLHPKATAGASRIESMAETRAEVEMGKVAADQAKGLDAAKSIGRRGKEWRRRTNDAFESSKRGEALVQS